MLEVGDAVGAKESERGHRLPFAVHLANQLARRTLQINSAHRAPLERALRGCVVVGRPSQWSQCVSMGLK